MRCFIRRIFSDKGVASATLLWLAALLVTPGSAHGEALSTTSLGMGSRTITSVSKKRSELDVVSTEEHTETMTDPLLCQRISAPSRIGLEIGAGGCMQMGGLVSFAQTVAAHGQVLWYPLASRGVIEPDDSLRMRRRLFGDFYLMLQGGFAKTSYFQSATTNYTLSMDSLEIGVGAGWSYRLLQNVAMGAEMTYVNGLVLSKSATGSTTLMSLAATVTVFL